MGAHQRPPPRAPGFPPQPASQRPEGTVPSTESPRATTHRARERSAPRGGVGGSPARPGGAGRRRLEAGSCGAQSPGRGRRR